MFENPNLMPSKRTEHPRIKTVAELTENLQRRKKLRMEYQYVHLSIITSMLTPNLYSRKSFFDIARLFGPTMHTVITNRHRERDIRLTAEADKAVVARMANRGSGTSDDRIELNIQLELQTLLCTEYRYTR